METEHSRLGGCRDRDLPTETELTPDFNESTQIGRLLAEDHREAGVAIERCR
jgi:hypothetical protein